MAVELVVSDFNSYSCDVMRHLSHSQNTTEYSMETESMTKPVSLMESAPSQHLIFVVTKPKLWDNVAEVRPY